MEFSSHFNEDIDLEWFGDSDLNTLPADEPEVISNRIKEVKKFQKSQLLLEHMLEHFLDEDNERDAIIFTDDNWESSARRRSGLPQIYCFPPTHGREFYTLISCGLSGTKASLPVDASDDVLREYKKTQRNEIICHVSASWNPLDDMDRWPISVMWSIMSYVMDTGYWIQTGADLPNQEKLDGKYKTRQDNGVRIPFVHGSKMTHAFFVSPLEHADFESVTLEDGVVVNYKQILFLTEREAQWKDQDLDRFMASMRSRILEGDQVNVAGPAVDSILHPFRPCDVEDLRHNKPRRPILPAVYEKNRAEETSSMPPKVGQWAAASLYNGQKKTTNKFQNEYESKCKYEWSKEYSLAAGMWSEKAFESDSIEIGYDEEESEELGDSPACYDIVATVHRGRNLVAKDKNILTGHRTASDPYVCVHYMSHMFGRTSTMWETLNPKWGDDDKGETFHLTVESNLLQKNRTIEFKIFDRDILSKDDRMGTVVVPLLADEKFMKWYPVAPGVGVDRCSRATGDLLVEIEVRPSSSESPSSSRTPFPISLSKTIARKLTSCSNAHDRFRSKLPTIKDDESWITTSTSSLQSSSPRPKAPPCPRMQSIQLESMYLD